MTSPKQDCNHGREILSDVDAVANGVLPILRKQLELAMEQAKPFPELARILNHYDYCVPDSFDPFTAAVNERLTVHLSKELHGMEMQVVEAMLLHLWPLVRNMSRTIDAQQQQPR